MSSKSKVALVLFCMGALTFISMGPSHTVSDDESPTYSEPNQDVDEDSHPQLENSTHMDALRTRPPTAKPLALTETQWKQALAAVSAPKQNDLHKEAALNPHAIPPSIFTFTHQLIRIMSPALTSRSRAGDVLTVLERYIVHPTDETPVVIQAICLTQALTLVKAQPSLRRQYEALLMQANPKAVQLMINR